MNKTLQLLILSDGKKGHENQSLGLAEALLQRREGCYETYLISKKSPPNIQPDAIIAAGHATHLPLLRLARRYRCPSIVIMKPSLPAALFSRALIPEHDLKNPAKKSSRIIPTKGSLNRIPETIPPKQDKGLIMLGGPSKHFRWDTESLLSAITSIVTTRSDLQWTLGDSRRTPPDCLDAIRSLNLPLDIIPHQESGPDWLRDSFLLCREAWLSPDSSSMLSEALTAGCHLGTLPLPPNGTRLSRAHDQLAAEGWLTPYSYESSSKELSAPPHHLHEASRCASLLLPLFQNSAPLSPA